MQNAWAAQDQAEADKKTAEAFAATAAENLTAAKALQESAAAAQVQAETDFTAANEAKASCEAAVISN